MRERGQKRHRGDQKRQHAVGDRTAQAEFVEPGGRSSRRGRSMAIAYGRSTRRPCDSRSAGAGWRATSEFVVGGDDHGGAQTVHLLEQLHQPLGLRVVEVAGGLVGQQQAGAAITARAIATRCCSPPDSSAGRDAGLPGQPDPAQHLADVGADLALRAAGDAQRQRDVVECRQMRQQAEILEHHADAAAQPRQQRGVRRSHVGAEDRQPAAGRADGEVHQAQQAGLAGAGRAEQPAERAVRQREAEIVQHLGTRRGRRPGRQGRTSAPHRRIESSPPFLPFRAACRALPRNRRSRTIFGYANRLPVLLRSLRGARLPGGGRARRAMRALQRRVDAGGSFSSLAGGGLCRAGG